MTAQLRVLDAGETVELTFADLLRFHSGGSPGGVAIAFKALERALPLLAPEGLAERRELVIRTAFGGPGACDGFECVTGSRPTVDPTLARPALGRTRERFVFVLTYRDREVTLILEPGFVTDEFITLAGTESRTPAEEDRLTDLKADLADRVIAAPATAVFSADGVGRVSEETVTVLFVDVEDAGALLERLGEQRFLALSARWDALLRDTALRHGGRLEPVAGAAHMVAFPSARAALECAVAVQRAGPPLKVQIGVHSGDVERSDGGLRGRVVMKAARIAALARGGEVLASGVVGELADLDGSSDVWLDAVSEVELRGLRGHHPVATVRWEQLARAPERVVLADDIALVRDGLAALLREEGLEVVAAVPDADRLHDAVARYRPDVVVVDIRMPPTHTDEGLVAAERIRRDHPEVGVLVLSQHVEPMYAERLLHEPEAGTGYLLKDRIADVDVLLDAIRRIARGGCVLDPGLTEHLVQTAGARGLLGELSDREREVLELIAQGLTNRAIAERLFVTGRTVETHVGQIFLKLGLREEGLEHRRVAAVIAYLRATDGA